MVWFEHPIRRFCCDWQWSFFQVDLLVIMDTTEPMTQRYLAVSRLLRPRPFPVDILVKTPQEVTQALESGDFFFAKILAQGKILYERRN